MTELLYIHLLNVILMMRYDYVSSHLQIAYSTPVNVMTTAMINVR